MSPLILALWLQAAPGSVLAEDPLDTARPATQQVVVDGAERKDPNRLRRLAPAAAETIIDIARQRVRPRFSDVLGRPVSVSAEYRWQSTQPLARLSVEAADPFGLGATVRMDALTGAVTYDVGDEGGPFRIASSGIDLRMRRDIGPRTTGEAHVRYRSRRALTGRLDAPSGSLLGFGIGLERRILASPRQSLDVGVRGFQSQGLIFTRGSATIGWRGWVTARDGAALAPSVLAAQMTVGLASRGTPADEMFHAGGAAHTDLPLRGHRLRNGGVFGDAPIARSVALLNVEWRQRLVRIRSHQLGIVAFYDGGHFGNALQGPGWGTAHDIGMGLRLGIGARTVVRMDYGRSLVDGKNALTVGLGEAF